MKQLDKSWQAPPFTEPPSKRMGWLNEQVSEGENWQKGQTAYKDIPLAIDIVSGKIDPSNQSRSDLNINYAKFAVRKIVATLADVRQVGYFESSFWPEQTAMFNKGIKAVAHEGLFPRKVRTCLQYMAMTGTGYIWPRWIRTNGGYGKGKFDFYPLGLMDVIPVQMPANNDLQGAYIVHVFIYMPVWEAHAKFPRYQASLLPVSRRRFSSSVAGRRLDLAERFRYGDSTDYWGNLYCEIRYSFIHDMTVNPFGVAVPMGEGDTSWSYTVPYLGQDIPGGVDSKGQRTMRKAEIEDCLLYPNPRLMISSRGMSSPMYDGPARDWHPYFPLAPYTCDDWPSESLGFNLFHDIHSSEKSRQRAERGIDQIVKARQDPAMAYDRSAGVNDGTAQSLDPFEDRKRLGVDGDPSKVLASLLPQWLLEVPSFHGEWLKYLKEMEDAQLGLNEVQALAEMKINMGGNALDKALGLAGPIVKDISFGMECSTALIWEMLKYMIPQHVNTRTMMQYVGPDNISPETVDFDPDSLVPSHGLDEMAQVPVGVVIPHDSIYSRIERLKMLADNLKLMFVPHTMHDITQMEEQLKYLQLFRGGFPIAPHDVAKKLNIENYGDIDGATAFDRWLNWEKKKLVLSAQAQQLASSLMPQGAGDQQGTGPKGGQKTTGGRAPSGQQAPKLKQKTGGGSGPRTTISESG